MGQHVPRRQEGLGYECCLEVPVDNLNGRSFQEHLVRLPIRLRGFGLRSMADTSPVAFIGGVELALGGEAAEEGWWRTLVEGRTRTGDEFRESWRSLQREGEQICNFLHVEFDGAIAKGADNAEGLRNGASSRQIVTDQREEWREALLAEALKQQGQCSLIRSWTSFPQLGNLPCPVQLLVYPARFSRR